MNDIGGATMLPFDPFYLYEQQQPKLIFTMPKVVSDQKKKFDTDELFRRLSRENEVRYMGFRDRPLGERQMRFQNACREGHTHLAILTTGTNLQLVFRQQQQHQSASSNNGYNSSHQQLATADPDSCDADFDKEPGKVHIKSPFIMNGVCVRWRGWFDLDRLDGVGSIEYDEETARAEDGILREQLEIYQQRLRDFEEKQRLYRAQQERLAEADVEVRSRLCRFHPYGNQQQIDLASPSPCSSSSSSPSPSAISAARHHPHQLHRQHHHNQQQQQQQQHPPIIG